MPQPDIRKLLGNIQRRLRTTRTKTPSTGKKQKGPGNPRDLPLLLGELHRNNDVPDEQLFFMAGLIAGIALERRELSASEVKSLVIRSIE